MRQQYLTAATIAEELGICLSSGYAVMRQCTRIVGPGRLVRVSRASFEVWQRRHEVGPDEPPAPARRPSRAPQPREHRVPRSNGCAAPIRPRIKRKP